MSKPTEVMTGIARLSYANVWEPKSVNGGPAKYSCSIIIPKSDTETVSKIRAAIEAAVDADLGKFNGKKPNMAALRTPLRDGDIDRESDAAYANSWFINANANADHPPKIVDRNVNPILDHSEIYSGVYARVVLNFFAYNTNGNKGVACGLGNIQKVRDGKPLGGFSDPKAQFSSIEDEDDEDLGL